MGNFDFHQTTDRLGSPFAFFSQQFGQPEAVHGLNAIKKFHSATHFIGLQVPDEMPAGRLFRRKPF
jgi:hypothetical protein